MTENSVKETERIRFTGTVPGWDVDWERYQKEIDGIHGRLAGKLDHYTGWVDWPGRIHEDEISRIETAAKDIQSKCTALVVIGVGGSYLGAKACLELLQSPFYNEFYADSAGLPKVYFAGHHVSSRFYADLLKKLDREEVCLCMISKSGGTLEPSVVFDILRSYMIGRYGEEQAAARIYAVTDACKGKLHDEAAARGYTTFAVPDDIGGRYSVLTPVGLLPVAAAGIDIREMLAGARDAMELYDRPELAENSCYRYGLLRNMLQKQGKIIEVFEVYEGRLRYFTEWLKQLFGESECKDGKGIIPMSLQMSTDLHSMGQFLQDGRQVFFETTITVDRLEQDISLEDVEAAGRAGSMHQLNDIIQRSVREAHAANATPQIGITVEDISPRSFGHMVYFFEKACAVSCMLTGVDPFDQPGVEAYKKNIKEKIK